MGKVNVRLKVVFVGFNVLFNVFGWAASISEVNSASIVILVKNEELTWVFITGIICISGLGITGGLTENVPALRIFASCMGVGLIITPIFGFVTVSQKEQLLHNNGSVIMKYQNQYHLYQIQIGMLFGFLVATLMGLAMSIMMITYTERHDRWSHREPPSEHLTSAL